MLGVRNETDGEERQEGKLCHCGGLPNFIAGPSYFPTANSTPLRRDWKEFGPGLAAELDYLSSN